MRYKISCPHCQAPRSREHDVLWTTGLSGPRHPEPSVPQRCSGCLGWFQVVTKGTRTYAIRLATPRSPRAYYTDVPARARRPRPWVKYANRGRRGGRVKTKSVHHEAAP